MGNQNNRPLSVVEQINQFDPMIFPEAAEETDALRKKLQITKDFKIIEAPAITPENQQLRQAVTEHNVAQFRELSARPGFNINAELDEKRRTAIQICALYPSITMLKEIMAFPHVALNHLDRNDKTALHILCLAYCHKMKTLQHGPEFDELKAATLEMTYVLANDPQINIDLKDSKGRTVGMLAALTGVAGFLQVFIARGTNFNLQDNLGRNSVHYACLSGDISCMDALLSTGASFDVPDLLGKRPIHYAAEGNNLRICKLLKSRNVKIDEKTNASLTPADLASDLDVKWYLENRFTNETHPYEIDFCNKYKQVPVLGSARIGMQMCPGRNKKNWRRHLDIDLNCALQQGIQTIVTLVRTEELVSMKIPHMLSRIRELGMESVHFPIIDKWIPDDLLAMIKCVLEMVSQVKRGRVMLVHCNGGKGRTGLLVVACLMALGMGLDEGVDLIREARPGMIYNPAQLVYLRKYRGMMEQYNWFREEKGEREFEALWQLNVQQKQQQLQTPSIVSVLTPQAVPILQSMVNQQQMQPSLPNRTYDKELPPVVPLMLPPSNSQPPQLPPQSPSTVSPNLPPQLPPQNPALPPQLPPQNSAPSLPPQLPPQNPGLPFGPAHYPPPSGDPPQVQPSTNPFLPGNNSGTSPRANALPVTPSGHSSSTPQPSSATLSPPPQLPPRDRKLPPTPQHQRTSVEEGI